MAFFNNFSQNSSIYHIDFFYVIHHGVRYETKLVPSHIWLNMEVKRYQNQKGFYKSQLFLNELPQRVENWSPYVRGHNESKYVRLSESPSEQAL